MTSVPPQGGQPAPVPAEVSQISDLSAAIAGIATLVILALGAVAWRRVVIWSEQAISDLRITRTQTTNGHKTNLRDDVSAIGKALTALSGQLGTVISEIREIRNDVRFAIQYTRDVDERLIEHVTESKKEEG